MKREADTHKIVLYPYSLTANVQNDYWYIWVKSGLLKYLCNKLRKKYEIPKLSESKDRLFGEIVVGDDFVSDSGHNYFDDMARGAEFEEEIKNYLVQLNLAEGAYWEVFDCVFYRKPLDAKLTWRESDIKAQPFYDGYPDSLDDLPVREFGSSRSEIKTNVEKRKKLARKQGIKGLSGFFKGLERYGQTVKGEVRQVESRKIYLAVITEMKRYKTTQKIGYYDGKEDYHLWHRQIAEKCASRIAVKLNLDKYEAWSFRQQAGRLYTSFPLLKDYILQSKS